MVVAEMAPRVMEKFDSTDSANDTVTHPDAEVMKQESRTEAQKLSAVAWFLHQITLRGMTTRRQRALMRWRKLKSVAFMAGTLAGAVSRAEKHRLLVSSVRRFAGYMKRSGARVSRRLYTCTPAQLLSEPLPCCHLADSPFMEIGAALRSFQHNRHGRLRRD